jgi:Mn2+/Fe2+ NRAMP family transporter
LDKLDKKEEIHPAQIEPGMVVEATEGDLGETDVSKPKVTDVVRDETGQPEKLVVKKGVIFQKKIEVPVERVQAVEPDPANPSQGEAGKVVIAASEAETGQLRNTGAESLSSQTPKDNDILGEVEQAIPTHEGLRQMELSNRQARANSQPPATPEANKDVAASDKTGEDQEQAPNLLKTLGPGFLAGMAGNDSSAVTSYSVDGATNGYSHLWLLLLSTPLYQSVQFTCAKIGRVTQRGLASLLRENYGRPVAGLATLILIVTNLALIAADLVAIGSAIELITGLSWFWFIAPVALFLWYITVFQNFEVIKKIFIVMSLAFVTYLITAVLSGANWGEVLSNTFIPHLDFGFDSISSAVALLGATISPYTMFWQVQGEKEEKRPGPLKQKFRLAALDIGSGVISGNLVSFAIIICTSATLFSHHQDINTAADAARALEPLLGPAAKYLFAIGLIGAGLVAIPVLLASTSYAVADTFSWPAGLSKKPWQSEGFYLILTVALIVGAVLALAGLDPIQLMFWANVLNGVLSPVMVVFLIIVSNNRKIMGKARPGWLTNLGLILTALIMFAAAGLLFYGLFTGQSK